MELYVKKKSRFPHSVIRNQIRTFPSFLSKVNPVRNSSGALAALSRGRSGLNPAGIILRSDPAAEQRGIISNGVKGYEKGATGFDRKRSQGFYLGM